MAARLVDRIVADPRVMMGKPVVKGTRIPVELILRRLGAGDGDAQILADYPTLSIEDIQRVVSRHYNVSRQELVSDRRTRVIVKPRQIAMYLAKIMTPRSLPEIGRRFGGRDHSTVLHAIRKIDELAKQDDKLARELELLMRLLDQ